ncbi:uncharacterized protein [Venturia canescens]|uniref:uncharacterized protein n=1 Tax=Venturia canescens TaxID=32260 RepID=UPI001C9C9CDD|nr:uncharacterized protein LOC122419378 [Venturia canescens]
MVFTAFSYVALAGAAWIFLRLLQACFWLPRHLRKQNDVQQMLQEKVSSYERYLAECEAREKAEENGESTTSPECDEKAPEQKIDPRIQEERWKERRECLEMLKKELRRVQNGGDIYDWDYLLEEDDKPEDEATADPEKTEAPTKEEISLNEGDCKIANSKVELSQTTEEKKEK